MFIWWYLWWCGDFYCIGGYFICCFDRGSGGIGCGDGINFIVSDV